MVAVISAGGVLGGVVGALSALTVDESMLRRLFAVFLLLTAMRLLARTRRRAHD